MAAMEIVPEPVFRVFSIDPGTNTLGVAVLDIDMVKDCITVQHAATLHIGKMSNNYPQIAAIHGDRVTKLYVVEKALVRMFISWMPDAITSEAPYMGAFPQAYAALVECVSAIRRAVIKFDRSMPFPTFDPATVKKSVGVSGKSGDKSAMNHAVLHIPNLVFNGQVVVADLDEHAIDAIAVGYAYYLQTQQGNGHEHLRGC